MAMATATSTSISTQFRRTSLFHSSLSTRKSHFFHLKASSMQGSEITEEEQVGAPQKKKIFVAGATGSTGKRIVEQLLAKGFSVKAGVHDIDKAKTTLPGDNPNLQIVSV
ncbi:uncharacterized protein At2g34460, chloroplastic-like isoform X2 [Olea europaea var. sylvestris]|uniref:uncharacterized protein At2g34460, chloroplastic-like isoform X2 n=1 Tax=Olea europaea var. sylvestris TaxID=158386 RepID=UPI000C1D70CA|nr:uncharacterized protein At2g34460, chloroplastic-like isoform X2 [Olea europaea var. sylvestris]